MIKKHIFGTPFDTEAAVLSVEPSAGTPDGFDTAAGEEIVLTRELADDTAIYGLGESVRGINKRGYSYVSFCTDVAGHTETTASLYAAHNFIIFKDTELLGLFVDCPGKVTFDLGFGVSNMAKITIHGPNAVVYTITGESLVDISKQLRQLTGSSYIPPKWSFGYQQSRWGYKNADDVRTVVSRCREVGCPIDSVYLDIDYMDEFMDFTVSDEAFGGFEGLAALSAEMKEQGVRLVPIIDAGVKIKDGYDVYEEGCEKGYFCQDKDGNPFTVAVWPGHSVFPDVLNPEARRWFGMKYKRLMDSGIEGFWNDMNEPSIFYTLDGINCAMDEVASMRGKNVGIYDYFRLLGVFNEMSRRPEDLRSFFHNTPQGRVTHIDVHNIFGYNMTRAAQEAFREIEPDKRILLFSRASYIGMHRYSGLWTGDNCAWWSHLLMNVKMMPSLNMCGFLYSGADLGGFGSDTSEDLVMRWLQFAIFTPLMRNHAAWDTREQEVYQFRRAREMAGVVRLRYRLIPYLYSEFIKAAKNDGMLFRPLAFEYPEDSMACRVEDQLMWGESVMVAPVCEQNAVGRYVYLPEDMLCVRFRGDEIAETVPMKKGHHYIDIPLTELVLFVRKGHLLPLADAADCVAHMDTTHLEIVGYGDGEMQYELLDDDGMTVSGIGSQYRCVRVCPSDSGWCTCEDSCTLRVVKCE